MPEEVFLVLGKDTRAPALNAAMEACFGTGFDPVDDEAWGRISLRSSRKMKTLPTARREAQRRREGPQSEAAKARAKARASAEAYGAMGVLPPTRGPSVGW